MVDTDLITVKILLSALIKLDLFKSACLLLTVIDQIRISKPQQFLTQADFQMALREEEVTFLTELDFVNARKFKKPFAIESARRNILTRQPFFRGDIRGKAALRRERRPWRRKVGTSDNKRKWFNGVANVVKKWPNGRIPYVLSLEYSARERAVLARAFQEYHDRTCIQFVPKTLFDDDYLFIGKIDGCYSDVGRAGGRQELSLDNGCLHLDTIIHELMHSVGFYHEHERWDRDKYLMILWQNIDKGRDEKATTRETLKILDAYDQFGRVDLLESSYYEMPYDYLSIMHYDSLAFSKNGLKTLVAREPTMTKVIGSAIDFSPIDLSKIRRMYQCVVMTGTEAINPINFVGDNSITNPNQVQEIGMPSFGMAFPLTAEAVNLEATKEAIIANDPSSTPLYLRLTNGPVQREQPTTKTTADQKRGNTMNGLIYWKAMRREKHYANSGWLIQMPIHSLFNLEECADKTNLCALWRPYCRSNAHRRIMRRLCGRSCNLCEEAQLTFATFYPDNWIKSFPFPLRANARR